MKIAYKDARDALSEPMLKVDEELRLVAAWQHRKDPSALEMLVRSHARLAYAMAARYSRNPSHIQDLAQEGMLGIVKAADRFRPECGTRFATYSKWWIMTFVSSAVAKVSTVVDMPSRTFLDAKMGKLPEAEQAIAFSAASGGVALDAPIGEDGDMTVLDLMECPRPNPEAAAEKHSTQDFYVASLKAAMRTLRPREAEVLKRRKLTETPETLEEIADDLGVTRERVRQIESQALNKLKKALMTGGFRPETLV